MADQNCQSISRSDKCSYFESDLFKAVFLIYYSSSDQEKNRKPVMECSLQPRIADDHLITTFIPLNIACTIRGVHVMQVAGRKLVKD